MDPIGGAASVITLLDLAIKTVKVVKNVTQSYVDAPSELFALQHEVDGLQIQLSLLGYVQESVRLDTLELCKVETETIARFIEQTLPLLSAICCQLETKILATGRTRRIKWALHDAAKVKEWEFSLQRRSSSLSNIILLLNLRYASILQAGMKDTQSRISLSRCSVQQDQKPTTKSRILWKRHTFGVDWIIPSILRVGGSVYSSKNGHVYVYGISLTLQALFCLRAFCIDLKLSRASMFSFPFPIAGSGLTVKNIVPESSDVMTACRLGDISTVWNLFQSGLASVNDITSDNRSPLRFAIESGSSDLISLLLSNGADVQENVGYFQTSPLHYAFAHRKISIIRLLLAKGAEVHHISANGWTPAFSLFLPSSKTQSQSIQSAEEFLDILSSASFTDFAAQDSEGWSCIHRAAAYGSANDIQCLSKLHAPLTLCTSTLSWTPIFLSVQFGNLLTFNELRKHYTVTDLVTMMDVRKWTLLHVAVNAKRLDFIPLLISAGADPHALSMASEFCVTDDLKGLAATPGDIAKLRGPQVFATYADALKEHGYEIDIIGNTSTYQGDLFWPALEEI